MPLAPGHSRGIVSNNIREMIHAGHPQVQAVAAALSNARRHPRAAQGGIVRRQDGGPASGEFLPSTQTENPLVQGALSQLSQIPTEKLQELAASGAGGPQQGLVQRLLMQRHMMGNAGPSPMAAGSGQIPQMQGGGDISWTEDQRLASHMTPHATGFIHSPVPGRTDLINVQPPVGAYVVPADVVSSLGEGNSLAGANFIQRALSVGPFGVPIPPHRGGGVGIPRPPQRFTEPLMGPAAARGGRMKERIGEPTPILAAGGEYVIPPHIVQAWGGGNLKKGHDVLDAWVVRTRKKAAKEMLTLKPPKKS